MIDQSFDNGAKDTMATSTNFFQQIQTFLGKRGLFWISIGTIALVLGVFIWFLFQPSGSSASVGLAVGQKAPTFTLKDPTGKKISLQQFRGHPVLVNFWGTFCGPCQTETPLLERTYQQYKNQGLVILGIDQGESSDAVAKFGSDYNLSYQLLLDTGGLDTNKAYNVTSLPASFFIDSQGTIRAVSTGVLFDTTLKSGLTAIDIH